MKEIKLTQGKVALVDDEDFEFLSQWKWCASKPTYSKAYYALRGEWIRKGKTKPILMQRVIMNTPEGLTVDHIDHNGLNNQKSNLRNCTQSQNRKNRTPNYDSTSKYLGVYITHGRIRSEICLPDKKIHIGCFKTEEEAAIAYDKVASQYYGEFANLNFK